MPEEEKPEVTEEEKKQEEEGEESEPSSVLDKARHTAERLEKANKEHEQLLEREERLHADRLLSGNSDAGQVPPPKKEPTDEEYAKSAISGELEAE